MTNPGFIQHPWTRQRGITLTEEANRRGFTLDETSIKESRQCYSDIIREIRESHY